MQIQEGGDRPWWGRWLGPRPSREPAREALSVAIASGKGGTGKSFLATNVAILSSQRGQRTTLVDCDFGLATDHLLLGVHPGRTLQHLFEGCVGPASCRTATPFGLRLVAGATGVPELAVPGREALHHFARGLGQWAADQDLLILDAGAGIAVPSMATIAAADQLVMVVQPEIAALTDAYAVIKRVARRPSPAPAVSVVVNRTNAPQHAAAAHRRLAEVAERFLGLPVHYLGEITEEPAVTSRRLGQPPLVASHPSCRTAREIGAILDRLTALAGGIRPTPRVPGSGIEARVLAGLRALG